eukprot:CAMPEP_0201722396 /NCGR_PEP_ID=MMETSP0593-20130828/6793_1 /ASSEMBLY_ACC=CAM_ASM_000672 /TAXON_ID=267983 /ORGANISM="Skeletonema japonicum, Strain CCMP2506" /LENGTH=692 /DNA_ID=CAMNT_0048213349 /DNA_START=38 /DNA_END=2116 /DNA_ORIENTATION=-
MPNSVAADDQHPNPHAAAWDPNALIQQPVAAAPAPTDHDAAQVIAQVMIPPEQQGYDQAVAAAASVEVPEVPAFAAPTQWDKNLGDLKAFKERFGHTNVTTNDHKELADWVFFQKQEYRNMLNGQATTLTPEQANQLLQLGLLDSTKPKKKDQGLKSAESRGRSKDEETWNARLAQLKQFHAHSGHFRVPVTEKRGMKRPRASTANEVLDAETVKLGKWVKRQRRQYTTDQLSSDRIAALTEIGFDFKPGNASKEERLEVQLGLLDSLRKRRELSNAQVADLNYIYDEWRRRGDEDKVAKPIRAKKDAEAQNKFNVRWMEKFEELKQFQASHGHTRVPQLPKSKGDESSANTILRALAKWVDYQRQCYWKKKKGLKAALTDDRIALLEGISFEWRIRVKVPIPGEDLLGGMAALGGEAAVVEARAVANPTDVPQVDNNSTVATFAFVFAAPPPRDEESENLHDWKWNCRYQELVRYRQQFGTTRVVYSSKIQAQAQYFVELSTLSKWVDMQRSLFQKRKKGEKNGLSKTRIKRLEDIDFDFMSTSGKAVDFRGWNAKLQRLKEYKARFGHTRVPARKKRDPNDPNYDPELLSLAKWVEHQRGMYWKRARGEKNALSDERIAALEAIGMEWRLVHTLGRPRGEIVNVGGLKTAEPDPVIEDHGEANQMSADALADTIDTIDSIPNMGPAAYSV